MKKSSGLLIALVMAFSTINAQEDQKIYQHLKRIDLAGNGGWSYMKMDGDRDWLYVTHQDRVHVIDLRTDTVITTWTGFKNAQGVWPGKKLSKAYINDAGSSTVEVYSTNTFLKLKSIPVPAKKLGWLLFDRFSQQAFVFGKESRNVVVIDGNTDKVTADIPLGGVSEFACTDDTAFVYATLRDKNEVVLIDVAKYAVARTYKLTEDKGPTGITIDVKNDRLMLVCTETNTMVVLSQSTGKKVASYPIGKGSEGIIYEKDLHLVITSNGEGSVSIFKQLTADDYQLVQTIKTEAGHKYMCHRGTTHKFYLSGVEENDSRTSKNFAVDVYKPTIQ